jgi:hypothetical protein
MEMKPIRDPAIISLVERIAEHYRINISSRFIRPVLLQMSLEKPTWDLIEAFTNSSDRYRECIMDELYRQIAALATFVAVARRDLAPNIKSRIGADGDTEQEKVFREMAAAAFSDNINVLADYLNRLLDMVMQIDQAGVLNGQKPMHTRMPELIDVKRHLGIAL